MKDKLNQFILDLQGQFVEVSDRNNVYQCMDLAYLWVLALGYPKATIQHLYAYQVYTEPSDLTRQYFDLIPNTPSFIPQDGDIAVFDKTASNIAGHIGIALGGGTTSQFRRFEQNYPTGTSALVRLRDYNTPKLLGVLRPKLQTAEPLPPVLTDPLLKFDFKGIQATPETEVYNIMELGVVGSKLIAKDKDILVKDKRIKELEATPPAPIFTKPIAKLYNELAKEFEKV